MEPDTRSPAPAKAAILNHALRLFATHGVEAVSVRDIARASGYSNPALFRHFESKDALARTLFETAYRGLVAAVDAPEARRGFEPWVAAALTNIMAAPEAAHFVLSNLKTYWPQMPGDLRSRNLPRMTREMIERAQADGAIRRDVDMRLTTMVILGALGQAARSAHFHEEVFEPLETARGFSSLLLAGLAPGRRP